ncbi:MAG: hypothetical protein AAF762_00725 [Pseudomonadota bacterium]
MTPRHRVIGLLLVGAAPRLAGALLIVAVLWGGYFLATASPGAF